MERLVMGIASRGGASTNKSTGNNLTPERRDRLPPPYHSPRRATRVRIRQVQPILPTVLVRRGSQAARTKQWQATFSRQIRPLENNPHDRREHWFRVTISN